MKFSAVIVCLWLTSCASGGGVRATSNAFDDIQIGSSRTEVVEAIGEPYSVRNLEDGSIEYLYVERIKAGGRNLAGRHYEIILKDGKVVSKKVRRIEPPAFYFDSYDMQTTQKSAE